MRTDFAQLRRLPDLLFPRRCPFCGSLLGPDALQGTVCPACVPEEMHLQHIPARLPEGEHDFYAVREAAAAYYYEDIVRTAVLRCKRGGCFWYARELADRVAVLVFGALPYWSVCSLTGCDISYETTIMTVYSFAEDGYRARRFLDELLSRLLIRHSQSPGIMTWLFVPGMVSC